MAPTPFLHPSASELLLAATTFSPSDRVILPLCPQFSTPSVGIILVEIYSPDLSNVYFFLRYQSTFLFRSPDESVCLSLLLCCAVHVWPDAAGTFPSRISRLSAELVSCFRNFLLDSFVIHSDRNERRAPNWKCCWGRRISGNCCRRSATAANSSSTTSAAIYRPSSAQSRTTTDFSRFGILFYTAAAATAALCTHWSKLGLFFKRISGHSEFTVSHRKLCHST